MDKEFLENILENIKEEVCKECYAKDKDTCTAIGMCIIDFIVDRCTRRFADTLGEKLEDCYVIRQRDSERWD